MLRPLSEFYQKREVEWCKPCHYERNKQWRANNPDRARELGTNWSRNNRIKNRAKQYGLSVQQVLEYLSRPCEICQLETATVIDHDHKCCPGKSSCGKCVRGGLCNSCNLGLSKLRESSEILRRAAGYIHKAEKLFGS